MFHVLIPPLIAVAALERATLLANHVLASEEVATDRLRAHAGRCVGFELGDLPSLLPPPPGLIFRITPAGMLEWCGAHPTEVADLHVRIDASNPAGMLARLLTGERPVLEVQGDATLAADLNWLIDNLRWDVEDDLARLVGPVPARRIAALSKAFASGLRTLLHQVHAAIERPAGRGAR